MSLQTIQDCIVEHQKVINLVRDLLADKILSAANICKDAVENGNKVLFCGNGGSAADSQHLAAEFVGRFQIERDGLAAISLTTDTSILTAVANDYGFETVFSRQVSALGNKGDVLVGLSTSGNSENVFEAIIKAKEMGIKTISLTGCDGGKIAKTADLSINIPKKITARVQEAHILIGHIICQLVDEEKNDK